MNVADAMVELQKSVNRLTDAILVAADVAYLQRHSEEMLRVLERVRQIAAVDDVAINASLEEVEKQHVLRALRHTNGVRRDAARMLSIAPSTLHRKLERWRLVKPINIEHGVDLIAPRECEKCREIRPMEKFAPDRRSPDGISRICDDCVKTPSSLESRSKRRKDVWGI